MISVKHSFRMFAAMILTAVLLLQSAGTAAAKTNATDYTFKKGPYKGRRAEVMVGIDPPSLIQLSMPENEKRTNIYERLFGEDVTYNDVVKGVTYDLETNTLTLDNFRRPDVYLSVTMMGDDFTIRVIGSCELKEIEISSVTYYGEKDEPLQWGGSATITGTGTLTVNKEKSKDVLWGISLWAEGSDARLNISKTVSLNVYGDSSVTPASDELLGEPAAIAVVRSAGFYDTEVIRVDSKPLQQVYPKYQMGGFMDESEPILKNYWVKASEVHIQGTGPIQLNKENVVVSNTSFIYNGKVQKPQIQTIKGAAAAEGTDYTSEWSEKSSKNVGSYRLTITGKGDYTGTKTVTYQIKKAENPLAVKGRTAVVKAGKLKKKAQTLKVSKVLNFTGKGKGALTYTRISGNNKITINKKTGKVTVKKGLKKGTYKVKIRVKAAGNSNYKASEAKTATFTIKVK